MKHLHAVLLNLLLGLLLGLAGPSQADEPASTPADHARIQTTLGRLPLYFVENRGQVGGPIDYYLLGGQTQVGLGAEGVTFVQTERPASDMKPESGLRRVSLEAERPAVRRHALQLRFVEAATVRPQGRMPSEARVNYFKGSKEQWKTGVPTYEEVVYSELWPGVDLVYRGTGGQMKSTFHVQPGANPTRIQLAYAGATGVTVTDAGTLWVETPITAFEEAAPVVYQEIGGEQRMVDARYQVTQGAAGEWRYWFALGEYDAAYPLVIDPVVLSYAGFIGGSGVDYGFGIAVDGTGATYVTGSTTSTEADFPVLGGPDLTYNGSQDAFVAKIKPDGSGLVYAGFIGGGGTERWSRGIAVDGSGAAYVTGWTTSTESTGFPVLVGPDLTFNGGLDDAFVAKIKPDGSGLDYAGYIGGSGQDSGNAIAVDGSGAAYVTGLTDSTEADFPVTVGPDLTANGGTEGFVAKVKPDGSGLDYAGYIGGSGVDYGQAIAVDGSGAAYVTGLTDSTEADFPVTVGPDLTANGGVDAFVAKVTADGTGLVYAGFIGGSGDDEGWGITVDGAGAAYGTGRTSSTESTGFPVLGGPDLTANGGQDGFVAKVKLDGSGLVYAGFIGGGGTDWSNGIAVDSSGAAYIVGNTDSTEVDFPVLVGPDLTFNGGGGDAFVAKVKPDGSGLGYAGYIGGSGNEYGLFIAVDGSGAAYVTGSTDSTETSFPVTVGPDLTANGGSDVFVAKILSSFVVTNLNDSGAGSLRQAVLDANAAPGADTITFQAGLTGTIALTSGQIDIAGDLILQGPGARILTVSGNNASRILTVAVGTTVTIDGLTLANGSSGSGNNGGAIDNQGALTVANSTLSGNRASYGGGIHNSSTGALTVTNSTLSGNVGTVFGGGIYNPGATGALTVTNSTLSGNRATYYGGGIYNVGTLTVTHSTLFDNRTGSTVNNSRGGGIYTLGDLIIGNSLVSANFSLVGKEIYNGQAIRFTSQGHNLFGVNGDAGLFQATPDPSDLIPGAGVLIGQLICGLANNGGPTQTHLLATGSPAIDAGDNALIPPGVTTDQRGPGFPRIVNTTVDIGAAEGSGACTIAIHTVTATAGAGGTISPPSAPVNDGATTTFTVTPDPNYAIQSVAGCGGTLAGNTYTTGPITADCTVGASFRATVNTLTVTLAGAGSGTVTSIPAGINCGADCTETYPVGAVVTLTAAPDASSTFLGWSGACAGAGNCTVTMDASQTVTAIFAMGATLTVNKTADTYDGFCDTVDCSLRDAVDNASDYDTIDFAPGLAGQTILLSNTITLNNSLMIQGLGAGLSTIRNDGAFVRAFVTSGTGITVIFDGLTFRGGTGLFHNSSGDTLTFTNSVLDQSGNAGTIGGAIFNEGTLTIAGSTLSNHTALEAGAIANEVGASLTILDSAVTDNTATRYGGAIRNGGLLTIRNSRLTGNSTTSQDGGAIKHNGGTLTITDSTLTGNVSADLGGALSTLGGTVAISRSTLAGNRTLARHGGAIYSEAILTLHNSTVSGNAAAADGYGGGIQAGGTTTISNSTITGNTANFGGGIKGYGPLTLGNNLVAGNTATTGASEIWVEVGNWNSQGYNLIGQSGQPGMGDGVTWAVPAALDFTPAGALNSIIGPLAANGGPTQTHLPVVGGPAIDAGRDALIPPGVTTDQRGAARIQGLRVDVGAVEGSSTTPTLSINNVSQNEGNSGTTPFNFTVTLSAAASLPVTVNWATADNTATAGSDYTAVSGSLTFPVGGPLTQTLTVQVIGDTTAEPNETFFVNLSTPVNATLAQAQGTGTIVNDDSPTLSINNVSQNEGNSGTTPFNFTVTLSAAASLPVTVNWATADDTATAGSDYTAVSGNLTFPVGGPLTQTLTVQATGDTLTEPNETFFVNLSTPVNATLAQAQGTGTIINDDATTGLLSIAWSGDQFVAVGTGGAILTSPDGANWTPIPLPAPTTQDLYGVAWSGQRFVVVGKSGTILTSPDGATWTAITPSPTTQPLYGITWAGGQFAAVGDGGAILTSADGLNWIVRVTGTP